MGDRVFLVHAPFHCYIALRYCELRNIDGKIVVVYDDCDYLEAMKDLLKEQTNLEILFTFKVQYGKVRLDKRLKEAIDFMCAAGILSATKQLFVFQRVSLFTHILRGLCYNAEIVEFEEGLYNIDQILKNTLLSKTSFKSIFALNHSEGIKDLFLVNGKEQRINHEDNTLWILGSAFVADGLMSEEQYTAIMKSIVSSFKGMKIYYLPHRRESSSASYRGLFESINKDYLPVEYFAIRSGLMPNIIIGSLSYAIYTLSLVFSKKDVSILLKEEMLTPNCKKIHNYIIDNDKFYESIKIHS